MHLNAHVMRKLHLPWNAKRTFLATKCFKTIADNVKPTDHLIESLARSADWQSKTNPAWPEIFLYRLSTWRSAANWWSLTRFGANIWWGIWVTWPRRSALVFYAPSTVKICRTKLGGGLWFRSQWAALMQGCARGETWMRDTLLWTNATSI